jgi:hypothetical protein
LQREGERAKQLGALDKHRGADLEVLRRRLHGVPPYRFPHRVEQHVACPAEQAPDDHALRVDEIAKARDGDTDLVTGVRDGPAAANVARDRKLDDSRKRRDLAVQAPDEVNDRWA